MSKERAINILKEQYARYHGSSETGLDRALREAIRELEGRCCDWCGEPLKEACISSDHIHMYCCTLCENYAADRRRIELLEKTMEDILQGNIIRVEHWADDHETVTVKLNRINLL